LYWRTSGTSSSERLENAILREEEHPDADAIVAAARRTESLLDSAEPMTLDGDDGVRLGPDLSIASVGQATRAGERSVRVPVVLGDSEGRTSTLVLTIQLDPLLDQAPD
jgi:hypothetical protein